MISSEDALQCLQEGNARFVSSNFSKGRGLDPSERIKLAKGQHPFAVVLGCSDSRVPPEIVFDQNPGDLFVVRVAGNVVSPVQTGSVEFAIEHFGAQLVVVLGHSGCGAIRATLDEIRCPSENLSQNLRAIIETVKPGLKDVAIRDLEKVSEEEFQQTVKKNIQLSICRLREESAIVQQKVDEHCLQVVGAEYFLESGMVEWFLE
tara:strand:- start:2107 stop:2721 length:615 start_codon:yes stop_codon:yes gene_type:complete